MGNSLQEQLLKAGLVGRQKARKHQADKRKATKRERVGQPGDAGQAKQDARQQQTEKAERDRELNLRRDGEAKKRELASQVKQLIETGRVRNAEGEVVFHFSDGSKLKRLFVTAEVQRHLSRGQLAVARLGGGYAVVSAEAAEKIEARDAQALVVWHREVEKGDEEDPYSEYQVPDDLTW